MLVYLPLQVLWIPVAVIGSLVFAYYQILVSRRLGVSQTAIEIINGRVHMAMFGLRPDPAAMQLARRLPNYSMFWNRIILLPQMVYFAICGGTIGYPRISEPGKESVAQLVTARTIFIDEEITRAIGDIDQFVILGAGFDTRAYGQLQRCGLRIFELDRKRTQQLKIAALEESDLASDEVVYVPTDLATEPLFGELTRMGFDCTRPAVFLWEGVTLYLEASAVEKTLEQLRTHAAPGSSLICDIYAERFVRTLGSGPMKRILASTGETLHFGLDFSADWAGSLGKFSESHGLRTEAANFMGSSNRKGPFMAVARFSF